MSIEAQIELFQAVKAHNLGLETTRPITSGLDLDVLDRRMEAAQRLLEWLSQALELHPAVFPAVRTPPPSSAPADPHQTPPSALDSPKTSRQWSAIPNNLMQITKLFSLIQVQSTKHTLASRWGYGPQDVKTPNLYTFNCWFVLVFTTVRLCRCK
jgi:hypothetical protein